MPKKKKSILKFKKTNMRILQKPFLGNFFITQKFGAKISYMRLGYHPAIDWGMPKGTPLVATFDGVVDFVKNNLTGYGKHFRISKGDCMALYAHCSDIFVKQGDTIKRGDIIAVSGNSGFFIGKTGNHLHFEVQWQGKYIDPLPFISWDEIEGNDFRKQDTGIVPASPSLPVVETPAYIDYVVKRGDSLFVLSKNFGISVADIVRINSIHNPNLIIVGQTLKMPRK